MSQSKRTRRLILCGICFEENCPYSRWVEDDEPDGELIGLLDEIQQLWLMRQHEQIDLFEKSRQQIETAIDTEVQAIANESGDTIEVQAIIDGEVQTREYTPITTDKGSFLEDILNRNAEHIERPADQNNRQQQH
jgi:hypothetical protein